MPFFEDLFKNKKLKELENILKNPKAKLEEKMNALGEYLIYLREHDVKKENEVFIEIIKKFKGEQEKQGIFQEQSIEINKETLFLVDKKNKRCLLNSKFSNVLKSFSQIQMTVFATTLEKKQPYLDIFVDDYKKSNTLRIDFKNVISTKSIDFELYLKSLNLTKDNPQINRDIKQMLSNKNIYVIDKEIELNDNLDIIPVNTKIFYESMSFMSEKQYPIYFRNNGINCLQYATPKEIERYIQNEESRYVPFGLFLEYCGDLNICINNSIITLPESLLKRNSNFYINYC